MLARSSSLLFVAVIVLFVASSLIIPASADDPDPAATPQSEGAQGRIFLPQVISDGSGQSPSDLAKLALAIISQRAGIPADLLQVAGSATATYLLLDKTTAAFKILSPADGQLFSIGLDSQGEEVDSVKLAEAERAAHVAKYGGMEPELAEQVTGAGAGAAVRVMIWLKEPAYAGPERPSPDAPALSTQERTAFLQRVDAQRAAAVEAVAAPVRNRLAALGYKATSDQSAPVLFAELDAGVAKDVARWPEVDTVYLDHVNQSGADSTHFDWGFELDSAVNIARQTIGAATINGRGITGSGVSLAQIEVGGRIATNNPYLAGVVQDTTYVCSSAHWHGTAVAGMMRSTNWPYRGLAYNASLRAGGSCGGWSSELNNRATAAVNWGARAINLSWGSRSGGRVPSSDDRFYDSIVINNYRTIVIAAGNEAASYCGFGVGDGLVLTPAKAYNAITVGNFDDRNTVPWSGDRMDSCSSWLDPTSTHNDREKPEVAAPGANIRSTSTSYPWVNYEGSGTSYAAPMVTSAAALLMQRASSLTTWPEAVKAILMASAVHNIEGSSRLSEKDGAGGVALERADDIARRVGGNWGAQSYSCSTTSPLDVATIYLNAGPTIRAAIVWDNDPSYSSYASQPGADLDVQLISPSGSTVAFSASWDNTYEMLWYNPTVSGNYKLRVTRPRCSYSPRWLGWAWRTGS